MYPPSDTEKDLDYTGRRGSHQNIFLFMLIEEGIRGGDERAVALNE